MKYDIRYVNSRGIELSLVKRPYRMQTTDLLDWMYDYTYTDSTRVGGIISAFSKGVQ